MFVKSRILALFSKGRRLRQSARQSQMQSDRVATQDIKESLGINEDFDYLDGLQEITHSGQTVKSEWLTDVKDLLQKNSLDCLSILRKRQQLYIKNIIQTDEPTVKLSQLFGLKIESFAKFRKWDEIAVDCDNRLKLIKQQVQDQKLIYEILFTYNQKCVSNIMNDHDRLHTLLSYKTSRVTNKKRKMVVDTGKVVDQTIMFYSTAIDRAGFIQDNEINYQIYFETIRMQAIGLLVLGEREKALKRLGRLLEDNFTSQMKQEIIPIIVTALSVQNKPKQLLRPQLIQKLSQIEKIKESEFEQMAQKSLDAASAQAIINKVALVINDQPLKEVQASVFKHYARLLCLIAENYYLQGKKEDSKRVLSFLKERQDVKDQIGIFITFIQMGIAFDNKDFEQVTRLFNQYKASQIDPETSMAGESFYNLFTINNDLLRVNICKLMANVFKQQSLPEKAEEMKDEAEAMQTTLMTYMLKQPQFDEIQMQKLQDWRFNKEIRIPYYYFHLKLDQYFEPDWAATYEAV